MISCFGTRLKVSEIGMFKVLYQVQVSSSLNVLVHNTLKEPGHT